MKITKISKLKDHRVFRDFSWPKDLPDFARYNVIYGWNGSGKTTLSSLLSCIERHMPVTEGQVEIELDNHATVPGSAFATAPMPNIRVFNRDFVERTIVAIQNGNIAPISVFIGEKKVEDIKKLNEAKNKLNDCNERLSLISNALDSAQKALAGFLIKGAKTVKDGLLRFNASGYASYNKNDFARTLCAIKENPIAPLDDQTKKNLQAKASQQPKERIPFYPPSLPNLDSLREQVCEILGESVVSKTIEELVHNPQLSVWVQTGLRLHSGENNSDICHFCGNPISAARKEQLEAHFNDSVRTIQQKIGTLLNGIKQHQARLSETINRLPHHTQFYAEFEAQCKDICLRIKNCSLSLHERLQLYAEYLLKKRENLFQSQTCDLQKADDDAILLPVRTAFADLANLIQYHADKTNTLSADCSAAAAELEQDMVFESLQEYDEHLSAINANKKEMTAQQATKTNLTQLVSTLELSLVEKSKAADELNKDLQDYLGRYEISFSVIDGQIGYKLLRNGQPATHLSEGELSAIAFLYFLKALLDNRFNLDNGIVVIDDPVSSLDSNSLFTAFSFMKERVSDCSQLFVLTHNYVFFRQVSNWFHHLKKQSSKHLEKRPARFYMLQTREMGKLRNAAIQWLDPLLEEFESEYHYLFKRVYELASMDSVPLSDLYEVPNIARRVLEIFLAYQFPCHADGLFEQVSNVDYDNVKKTTILRLLNTCSHGGGIRDPEHDPTTLSEGKKALQFVMEMIQTLNPSHYDGMVALIRTEDSEDDTTKTLEPSEA